MCSDSVLLSTASWLLFERQLLGCQGNIRSYKVSSLTDWALFEKESYVSCNVPFSEDAEKLRIHALAEAGDLDSLEKMVEFEKAADSSSSSSDREDSNEEDDSTTVP